jgi:hypothetical protein
MAPLRKKKYDEAYGKYLSGLSLEQVAQELGMTRQSVYGAFKLRGFTLRSPNFQPECIYDGKKFTLRPTGYMEMTTPPRTAMHRYVWTKERGPIPRGWDIHHIDECKTHNDIGNLECLPKAEHTRKYSPHNNQYTRGRKRIERCGTT